MQRLKFEVLRIGHDELQCQRLEHHHLSPHRCRHFEVGLVANQRPRAGEPAGLGNGRRGKPAHQLTGQPLEGDRCRQGPVVGAGADHHRKFGEPLGSRHQVLRRRCETVCRSAQLRQCRGGIIIGQDPQVNAAGDHAVLHIVDRVGHIVGPVHDLRLQAGVAQRCAGAHPVREILIIGIETELATMLAALPRILGDGIQSGTRQIQPDAAKSLPIKHFRLESGQDPKVLGVSFEASAVGGELVESPLTVVPVRRMSDVMGQTSHIHQVGITTQRHGHTPADLGDLQRVSQPGAGVVTLPRPDHLGLIGQSAQGGAVQHPGAVPGEVAAVLGRGSGQGSRLRRLDHQSFTVGLAIVALLFRRHLHLTNGQSASTLPQVDRDEVLLASPPGLLHWRSCACIVCSVCSPRS